VEGGIGLVITGYAGIMRNGKSSLHHMTMIDDDELVPAHRAMVGKIHDPGGRIVCRIAHYVSLARPLLLEPDLANKFLQNESAEAKCDNCNISFLASDTAPIRCHRGEFG